MKLARQGDVLLVEVATIPGGCKKKDLTIAYGEVTGHHHTFDSGECLVSSTGQQYVQLENPANLTHQEHDTITFQPGKDKVVLQREYDLVEGVRQVMD